MKIRIYSVNLEKDVPSFKNLKSIWVNKKTKKPFIATNPQYKATMDELTLKLKSSLILEVLGEPVTLTTKLAQFMTVWFIVGLSPTTVLDMLIEDLKALKNQQYQA